MTEETPALGADVTALEPVATTQTDSEPKAEEPQQAEKTEAEIKLAKALDREKRKLRQMKAKDRETAKAMEELQRRVSSIEGSKAEDSRPKMPKLEDYNYEYDRYLVDHEKYLAALSKRLEEGNKPEVKTTKDAYRESRIKALDDSGDKARKKYQDFDEVLEEAKVGNALPLEQWVWNEILEYDSAAELLYKLAKDEDLEELNGLSKRALQRKLDSLEAEPEQKETTKAPAPMKAVKGTGAAKKEKSAAELLAEARKL